MSAPRAGMALGLVGLVGLGACGPGGEDIVGTSDATPPLDAATGATDGRDSTTSGDGGPTGCSFLPVTVRDFRKTHPDFERFTSDAVTPGLVQPMLGPDQKPVYAPAGPTVCTTGPAEFADWYHDVAGTNQAIPLTLELLETSPGVFVYDNSAFFPIDNQGFGNEGFGHNFSFTTEIHTSFRYQGGESFTFRGDDDLWLFINGRLAIDLGGLHQPAEATVDLDAQAAALGLVRGEGYAMDIFQAERHTTASNFRIETTIDCFIIP